VENAAFDATIFAAINANIFVAKKASIVASLLKTIMD
jgi:hypothetical protein